VCSACVGRAKEGRSVHKCESSPRVRAKAGEETRAAQAGEGGDDLQGKAGGSADKQSGRETRKRREGRVAARQRRGCLRGGGGTAKSMAERGPKELNRLFANKEDKKFEEGRFRGDQTRRSHGRKNFCTGRCPPPSRGLFR